MGLFFFHVTYLTNNKAWCLKMFFAYNFIWKDEVIDYLVNYLVCSFFRLLVVLKKFIAVVVVVVII